MDEKIISNLRIYPFNTTMMGVLKGVCDYFELGHSDAWLFGGSGHAFIINIHEELCPSGPYVWNYQSFYKLLRNLGISMNNQGFFHPESAPDEMQKVEEVLKRSIDAGTPCSLLNMENQLISGYNDDHFIVEKPWPKVDSPITPETLTFQTWAELGDEFHITFFTFTKTGVADHESIIKESLSCAVDMTRTPDRYIENDLYHVGLEAYDTWVKAVKEGHGASHGNWWNGTVWWECREMASKYFSEIASSFEGISEQAMNLSEQYGKIAKHLKKARDKKLADDEKIEILLESRKTEETCIGMIEELLDIF